MQANTHTAAYEGGFESPVFGAQAAFRSVMDAMARPGTIVDLGHPVSAPAPLETAAAAFLAALADYDSPVWFEADDAEAASAWVEFQTGAPVVGDPDKAAFAVLAKGSAVANWRRFSIGTASYPDASATLLLPVDALEGGDELILTGPGIETQAQIAPRGLPEGFVAAMQANAALYPLGLDVLLICGSRVSALPRTTRLQQFQQKCEAVLRPELRQETDEV